MAILQLQRHYRSFLELMSLLLLSNLLSMPGLYSLISAMFLMHCRLGNQDQILRNISYYSLLGLIISLLTLIFSVRKLAIFYSRISNAQSNTCYAFSRMDLSHSLAPIYKSICICSKMHPKTQYALNLPSIFEISSKIFYFLPHTCHNQKISFV